MRICGIEVATRFRYTLTESELEEAARDARTLYLGARTKSHPKPDALTHSVRELTIARARDGSHELHHGGIGSPLTVPSRGYRIRVEFDVPVALSLSLLDFELSCLSVTGLASMSMYRLSNGDADRGLWVLPADLNALRDPWRGNLVVGRHSDKQPAAPYCQLNITIHGNVRTLEQKQELRALADEMYLPECRNSGAWKTEMQDGGSIGGVGIPEIRLAKYFSGAMTPVQEDACARYYTSIVDWVVRHKISEDFVAPGDTCTWAEMVDEAYRRAGIDGSGILRAAIQSSNLSRQVEVFAPDAWITAVLPDPRDYADNRKRELILSASRMTAKPQLVVINHYAWRPR